MISDGLTYPLRGSGKLRHLFGGIAILFAVLILPIIPLVGYYIHAITFKSLGNPDPPSISEYSTLLKNGVIGSVIIFTYSGIFIGAPMILITYIASVFSNPSTIQEVIFVLDWLFYLLLGFTLIMLSILPIILCQYGRTGSFNEAYNVEHLFELLQTKPVLKAIGSSIVIGIGAALIFGAFSFITLGIGILFTPFVLFWFILVTASTYGQGIGVATGTISPTSLTDAIDKLNSKESTTTTPESNPNNEH